MMKQYRQTYAEINFNNLAHNISQIKKHIGHNTFLCPMVKANAYGHGDIEIALKLEKLGVQNLGVGLIEEGILLRQFGVKINIFVFCVFDQDGAAEVIKNNMIPVISSWEQLEYLDEVTKETISVHVKFDTGMHRLGFDIKDLDRVYDFFISNPKFKLTGLCTHMQTAEDALDPNGRTQYQLGQFKKCAQKFAKFKPILHALNSAGMILLSEQYRTEGSFVKDLGPIGVRPGLAIYGLSPMGELNNPLQLKSVMTLKSKVAHVLNVAKGEVVSYSGRWMASRDSIIGIVPIGYADGYHRLLSNQAFVHVLGTRASVVGSVCMDYIMIDLTEIAKSHNSLLNQDVVLFGFDISAYDLAEKANTICYEILTSVGVRVPRVYVE